MKVTDENESKGYAFGDTELHTAENYLYKDTPLTPKMISSLMHVDTKLREAYIHEAEESKKAGGSALYVFGVIFGAVLIATMIGASFLYYHGIGPFYSPLEASSNAL